MKHIEKWTRYWKLKVIWEWEKKIFPSWQSKRTILCKCDCWKEVSPYLQKLEIWETTSCWCNRNNPAINRSTVLVWEKYNRLTILIWEDTRKWRRYVNVKCDCWTCKQVELYSLRSWWTKSCWCLNKEKIKRNKKTRDRVRLVSAKRRAIKKSQSDWTLDWLIWRLFIPILLDNQIWECNLCWCDIVDNYHIDHIYPLSKWWIHWISNIQLLCPTCNMKKGDRI